MVTIPIIPLYKLSKENPVEKTSSFSINSKLEFKIKSYFLWLISSLNLAASS